MQCMLTTSLTIYNPVHFFHATIHNRPAKAKCTLTSAYIDLYEADLISSMFFIVLERLLKCFYSTAVSGQNKDIQDKEKGTNLLEILYVTLCIHICLYAFTLFATEVYQYCPIILHRQSSWESSL